MIDAVSVAREMASRIWRVPGGVKISDVRAMDGVIDLRVTAPNGISARLRVPVRAELESQPWLYVEPDDANDWIKQFVLWVDEEVGPRIRDQVDFRGEHYVLAPGVSDMRELPPSSC